MPMAALAKYRQVANLRDIMKAREVYSSRRDDRGTPVSDSRGR